MKECKKIKFLIQKYLDKELTQQQEVFLKQHLEKCDDCRQELDYYLKIKENLSFLKVPQLKENFSYVLHSKLRQLSYESMLEKKLGVLFLRYAVVMVIIFVIIFAIFLNKDRITFVQPYSYLRYSYGEYNLAGYEIRDNLLLQERGYIRIKLTAKKELKNAKVEIELPEGIVTSEGKRVVYWEGDLKPQENYLVIKVRAVKEGEFPVKIRIKKGSFEKDVVKKVNVVRM